MGVPVILGLILFIWLPLLSFSLLNRIGIVLPPNNVVLTIGVEGYPVRLYRNCYREEWRFNSKDNFFNKELRGVNNL